MTINLGNDSYLGKFVVDESVDECRFTDFGIADEDDVTVVSGLGQTVTYTSHFVLSFFNLFQFSISEKHENTFFCFDFGRK